MSLIIYILYEKGLVGDKAIKLLKRYDIEADKDMGGITQDDLDDADMEDGFALDLDADELGITGGGGVDEEKMAAMEAKQKAMEEELIKAKKEAMVKKEQEEALIEASSSKKHHRHRRKSHSKKKVFAATITDIKPLVDEMNEAGGGSGRYTGNSRFKMTGSLAAFDKDFKGGQTEEPLPDGWATAVDPKTGREYYFRSSDNKVSWTRPTSDM
jgi:ATP-dependent helicase YprA (DUF1998 family)